MNAILSQFSITVLIRQFFCGVVFFLPSLLVYGAADDKVYQVILKAESSFAIGIFVALACIIGTIIHHIEKNSYSYVLQGLFCYFKSNESVKIESNLVGGFAILLALIGIICALSDAWFWYTTVIISFFIVLNLSCFLDKLLAINQKIWIISETSKIHRDDDYLGLNLGEKNAILTRLDAWSDNIHCVQSCCFAWLLGLCLAKYFLCQWRSSINIIMELSDSSCASSAWVYVSSAEAQLQSFAGWSVALVFLILLWEACFEWHRFQHLHDITKNMKFVYTSEKK